MSRIITLEDWKKFNEDLKSDMDNYYKNQKFTTVKKKYPAVVDEPIEDLDPEELISKPYSSEKCTISDELAHYALDYFNNSITYNAKPIIPKDVKNASLSILQEYSDGFLYRGIKVDDAEYDKIKKTGKITMVYSPHSWTWDEETALAFSDANAGKGKNFKEVDYWAILMKRPIQEFDYFFSMDVIMDNLSDEQILKFAKNKRLKEIMHDYISESEIVCWDKFEILIKDLKISAAYGK